MTAARCQKLRSGRSRLEEQGTAHWPGFQPGPSVPSVHPTHSRALQAYRSEAFSPGTEVLVGTQIVHAKLAARQSCPFPVRAGSSSPQSPGSDCRGYLGFGAHSSICVYAISLESSLGERGRGED